MGEEDKKIRILSLVLVGIFVALFLRLFELQVMRGKENRLLAESNRVSRVKIAAPRGLLFDRHGEVLSFNEPNYFLEEEPGKGLFISRDEALARQGSGEDANLKIVLKRVYPEASLFAHALGYLAEVTEKELTKGKLELKGYDIGSLIGRSGLEAEYEELLQGREGSELMEVDTRGKAVRRLGQILAVPGKALTLAIDKKLQAVAAEAMKGKKGGLIATSPQNGEVLLLYSSPSFDSNLFSFSASQESLRQIVQDEENQPLLNRAIAGVYPPGSTFKIVTAVAGLEEGKITGETLINDPGVIVVNDYKYSNWFFTQYGRTEGEINLIRAITRSTDTFFYKVGEWVGVDNLVKWTKKFNLDQTFGLDLPGEAAGFVATPEWKEKERGERWFLGNTYHLAIGQGDVILTPLGVNLMTAVVASGGQICLPRMLRIGAENTPYQAECRDLGIKKEYLELIKKGMIGACSSGGTAYPFFDFVPRVACKTGTAETGDGQTSHAWFTVFAPAVDPQIVLTVLVEKGGEGSSVAAPMAKEILNVFFKQNDY